MELPVTSLYATLLALGVIVLSNIVSARRGKSRISILHGEDMTLALWMRRHGNLAENAPLVLILFGLAELNAMPQMWLHALGLVLIAARTAHVFGLSIDNPVAPLRIAGGALTQIVMLVLGAFLIWSEFGFLR